MARNIRVRAIKRREVDEDKLAVAFLMLAKVVRDKHEPESFEPESDVEAV
jgi:hypothetical protein